MISPDRCEIEAKNLKMSGQTKSRQNYKKQRSQLVSPDTSYFKTGHNSQDYLLYDQEIQRSRQSNPFISNSPMPHQTLPQDATDDYVNNTNATTTNIFGIKQVPSQEEKHLQVGGSLYATKNPTESLLPHDNFGIMDQSEPKKPIQNVFQKTERDVMNVYKVATNVSWIELVLLICIFVILALVKGHVD